MCSSSRKYCIKQPRGFGLVETIVGVAIFALVATASYGGFVKILQGVKVLQVKNVAAHLANEQIEIVRNLPYADVGIVGGLPSGKIPREQILTRGGIEFSVTTSVRDVDDPFDGQIGGVPNDLSPADYKLVEVHITCLSGGTGSASCDALSDDLVYYTRVAPYALETTGNNGALFVQVLDAIGQPVSGADVHIENNQQAEPINIDEVTGANGMFQIVDAPPGTGAYEISVTKDGDASENDYSTERTYTIGSPENPNPNKPHANVAVGQVTQISFTIDELADLDIRTRRDTCASVGGVDFDLRGSKTIGMGGGGAPIYKYSESLATGGSGLLSLGGMEWDNYLLTVTDGAWQLAGANPLLPLELNPAGDVSLDLILELSDPNALLIQVVDGQTGLPVSDAIVQVESAGGGGEDGAVTGRGFKLQTDWQGGSGQTDMSGGDPTRYYSASEIGDSSPAGQIKLSEFGGIYSGAGWLESSTFDTGTTTNFGVLTWDPIDQAPQTGADSVRFQVATNLTVTATTTWDFVGPDGGAASYYTSSGEAISATHDGDRYLRYKVFLQTADNAFTPAISNVAFTFTTDCLPPGQVFFGGLGTGEYTINVDHDDYVEYEEEGFTISAPWTRHEIILTP